MASSDHDFQDPYLDPGAGLLRNKPGLTLMPRSWRHSRWSTEIRAMQLARSPVPFTGDLHLLRMIHHHLFQDVYDWAGQLRTVDIRPLDSVDAVADVQHAAFFARLRGRG